MTGQESTILKKISEGDENAFRELFAHYYPKVLTRLNYYISSKEDIRDLAQSIFAKIWLMRDSLPEIRSFGAFLQRVCRNAAVDYCRKHKIWIPLDAGGLEEPAAYPADMEYLAEERRSSYDDFIGRMPWKRREVFRLSRKEGLSNDEISKLLGISKKTVENHINAALKGLRKIVS